MRQTISLKLLPFYYQKLGELHCSGHVSPSSENKCLTCQLRTKAAFSSVIKWKELFIIRMFHLNGKENTVTMCCVWYLKCSFVIFFFNFVVYDSISFIEKEVICNLVSFLTVSLLDFLSKVKFISFLFLKPSLKSSCIEGKVNTLHLKLKLLMVVFLIWWFFSSSNIQLL